MGAPDAQHRFERAMAANLPISSSVIANSTARRHLAMMPLLVRSNTNEEFHERVTGSMTARFMESVV
jgi:hypothetical protein